MTKCEGPCKKETKEFFQVTIDERDLLFCKDCARDQDPRVTKAKGKTIKTTRESGKYGGMPRT